MSILVTAKSGATNWLMTGETNDFVERCPRFVERAASRLSKPLVLGMALAMAAPASAQAQAQAQDASAVFAAEALRICIDTRAAATAIRTLAAAERWTSIDPGSAPSQSSIELGDQKLRRNVKYNPSNAWTFDKAGVGLTVAVFDIPNHPKVKHCEVMAWNLDSTSVDLALKSDPRVKGGFFERPGLPLRRYDVRKPRAIFRYGAAERGSKTLHVVVAG